MRSAKCPTAVTATRQREEYQVDTLHQDYSLKPQLDEVPFRTIETGILETVTTDREESETHAVDLASSHNSPTALISAILYFVRKTDVFK